MKVKEVKRKAKVGEWIKIVKEGFSEDKYKKGDILQVRKVGLYDEPDLYCEGSVYCNGIDIFISSDEYVVLENYNPIKEKEKEMKEFRFEDYKGGYVMWCKTIDEAKEFCRFMHDKGRRWCSNKSYLKENHWIDCKENTCYHFNMGEYSSKKYYENNGYTILEWSDFKPQPKNQPIVIYQKDNKVIALDKNTQEKGIAICHEEDVFDFNVGAKIAFDRLMEVKEKEELLNGKFLCVREVAWYTTKGKVYDFVDGVSKFDDGRRIPLYGNPIKTLDELNKRLDSQFIKLIDDELYYTEKVVYTGRDAKGSLTKGKVYNFVNGMSKYDNGENMPCMSPNSHIRTLEDVKRLINKDFIELKEENAYYTGKVVYVGEGMKGLLTQGKVYNFVNGMSKYDDGQDMPCSFPNSDIKTFEDIKELIKKDFIELKEENTYYTGKVVYIGKSIDNLLTQGKVYNFVDGFTKCDNGMKLGKEFAFIPFKNIEELMRKSRNSFIELK